MRTHRNSRKAAAGLALLILCGLTIPHSVAAGPAATPQQAEGPVVVRLTPHDGSTNVHTTRSGLQLGAARASAGSTEITERAGYANLAPVELEHKTGAVEVSYDAVTPGGTTAEVDVRTRLSDGRWTEWTVAEHARTTRLPVAGDVVQLRALLTAKPGAVTPRISDMRVAPAAGTALSTEQDYQAEVTSTVYATREGLVGGTTANGHVIVERDHFVALPSRRGLSDDGDGTYSVQACANDRCIWEPVWDVGPWNTKDDYWNPSDEREMWQDLPQGLPEAQAAYEDGYNGGRDEFGRTVQNPAGIDLADGAFWDGLGMSDNGWVEATYLWTVDANFGIVRLDGGYLNVRSGGSTGDSVVGMAGNAAHVPVSCAIEGETVTGSQGTSSLWLQIHEGMYVSKAYIEIGEVPYCMSIF